MEHTDTPDPTRQLPRSLYYQIVHELRSSLPKPVSESAEDVRHRDRAAIAQVASLLPASGEEVVLAAQFVSASAQALDCLRLAHSVPRNVELAMRCTAQAAAMMRQARAARTMLMRVQAERHQREADGKARDATDMLEHCTRQLMAESLANPPAPAPEPAAVEPAAAKSAPPISFSETESHDKIVETRLRSMRRRALLNTTTHRSYADPARPHPAGYASR